MIKKGVIMSQNQQQVSIEKVTGSIYRMLNQVSTMVGSLEDALNAGGKQLEELNKKVAELSAPKVEEVKPPDINLLG